MAYGKIFESMFTGSMVGAGCNVFALWSYVIANAKPPGTVELNPKLLASVFGCSPADVNNAIDFLCKPDVDSRSKEHDGRRLIREGQFLYAVPTWAKYNAIRNEIERRLQNREAQKRWRERQRSGAAGVSDDALTDADGKRSKPIQYVSTSTSTSVSSEGESTREGLKGDPDFDRFWSAYDKKVDREAARKAWRRLSPSQDLVATIIDKAAAYVRVTPDKAFRKNASTWINGRCWENDLVQGSPFAGRRQSIVTTVGDHSEPTGPTKNGWSV